MFVSGPGNRCPSTPRYPNSSTVSKPKSCCTVKFHCSLYPSCRSACRNVGEKITAAPTGTAPYPGPRFADDAPPGIPFFSRNGGVTPLSGDEKLPVVSNPALVLFEPSSGGP